MGIDLDRSVELFFGFLLFCSMGTTGCSPDQRLRLT